MSTLEKVFEYAEERQWALVEIEPNDLSADHRAQVFVDSERQQILVEIGWGASGLYANVRLYVEGEPVEPGYLALDGTVTVFDPTA